LCLTGVIIIFLKNVDQNLNKKIILSARVRPISFDELSLNPILGPSSFHWL
jgi:uncharacterized iron-regulated membrane protein